MSTPTTIGFKRRSSTVPGTPYRVVVLGDSITAFSWYQFLAAQVAAAQVAASVEPTPSFPFQSPFAWLTRATAPHLWINSGIAGDDCTCFLLDTIAARVAAFKPDLVIVECGVNCQQHGGVDPVGVSRSGITTTDAVCTTNHALIISQIHTQCPLAQVVWIGAWLNGEQWPDGTNQWDKGALSLDAKNAITIAACAAASPPILYVDVRTPTMALLPSLNPGNAQTGILTNLSDGIHPGVTPQPGQTLSGQQQWANVVFPLCVFS